MRTLQHQVRCSAVLQIYYSIHCGGAILSGAAIKSPLLSITSGRSQSLAFPGCWASKFEIDSMMQSGNWNGPERNSRSSVQNVLVGGVADGFPVSDSF